MKKKKNMNGSGRRLAWHVIQGNEPRYFVQQMSPHFDRSSNVNLS
jgi:hypothetical protein